MNEELNKLLVNTIQKMEGGIEKGIDFAQQQLPDLVRQLLLWEFSFSVFWVIVCSFLIGVCIWWHKRWDHCVKSDGWENGPQWVPLVVGIPLVCIPLFVNLTNAMEIVVAPKLYLFQYAASLVKGK